MYDRKEWDKELCDKVIEKIELGEDTQDMRRFFFNRLEVIQEYDFKLAEDYMRRYMDCLEGQRKRYNK